MWRVTVNGSSGKPMKTTTTKKIRGEKMFMILDTLKMEIFYSDNYKRVEEIQDEVGFHPSYRCDLMIYHYGDLAIENSCGEIKDLPRRYQFIEYVKEEVDDPKIEDIKNFWSVAFG